MTHPSSSDSSAHLVSTSVAPRQFSEKIPNRALGRLWNALGRGLVVVWKWLVGAFFTQSLLGGVLVIGWGLRLMQRSTLKRWWYRSSRRQCYPDFAAWAADQDFRHPHRHWPNWFMRQSVPEDPESRLERTRLQRIWLTLSAPLASFALNLKLGLQGMFNTWVLTLPGCLLMLFSWYDGWNNSFNKGYEQAPVGPVTGILGILLFLAAMLYVPLAQARQAASGDWRDFYDFRIVWGMVRRHGMACLILAAAFTLASIPFTVIKTAPYFFAHQNAIIASFTPEQAVRYLHGYFFGFALLLFPLWIGLRLLASRIYANAVLHGLQSGHLSVFDLSEHERAELGRLDLIQVNPPRSRHVLLQVATTTGAGLMRMVVTAVTVLVWFTFVAQIYIAEFLMYHPVQGWMNQPLIQLPWFHYVPPQLQNPMPEIALTLLFLVVVFGGASTIRRTTSFFRRRRRVVPL